MRSLSTTGSFRRRVTAAVLASAATFGAVAAEAATFTFAGGNYMPGITSPNPLLAPDVLDITTSANKIFGTGFTNQSGIVNWFDGTIFLGGGSVLSNQSVWNLLGNNVMTATTGGGSFNNSGTLAKNGGTGNSTISIAFINSGLISTNTGTLVLNGGSTFNAGTVFAGAGTTRVAADAAFTSSFTSSNLELASGTFTGAGAELNGAAAFTGGGFAGDWAVANAATLTIADTSNKFFAGTFTNNGTVDWTAGSLFQGGGGAIVNTGTWNATGNNVLTNTTGGGSFTNSGTLLKSGGGAGATTFNNSSFTNSGTIDAQTGSVVLASSTTTINAGSVFTGAGIVNAANGATFNGAFTSSNLDLTAGTFTGAGATLVGTADYLGGGFAGGWTIADGSTLTIADTSNKEFSGSFTNAGTVDWTASSLFLGGGGAIVNTGTWNATGNNVMTNTTGGGSFTNGGTLVKSGGTGATTFSNTSFTNDGTIDAQTGSVVLNAGTTTINAGSVFTGSGIVNAANGATFNGAFTSSNLDFTGGTFTGAGATLQGTADFLGGGFAGGWTVADGSTLTIADTSNKFFGAGTFTNAGTVNWTASSLFLGGGGAIVNTGAWNATGDNTVTITTGGGSFTNGGTFAKTGGAGITSIASSSFTNTGTLDAQVGVIALNSSATAIEAGSVFTGAGTVRVANGATFTGGFTSSNLDFTAGTYTGVGAALTGSADFLGGTFAGGWTVNAGSTLTIADTSNKFFGTGTFTNAGTVNWTELSLFLGGGANIVNAGTLTATGNNTITATTGGGSLTNTGLIQKTGGTGTTTLASGTGLTNLGTISAQSGTIALPANFANAGTLTGSSLFSVSGTLTNNGIVAPGAGGVGTLGLTGDYAQSALGTLAIQIGGGTADLFNVSGTASLNGTLALFCASCSLTAGDTFTVLNSVGNLSGAFANVTASGFLQGFAYDVLYDTVQDRVQLVVTNAGMTPPGVVPEPQSWAMLILGFGLVGGAARRRKAGLLARA